MSVQTPTFWCLSSIFHLTKVTWCSLDWSKAEKDEAPASEKNMMKYIWLVQIFFGMCILKIGVSWSNLTVRIFFRWLGAFNHQLESCYAFFFFNSVLHCHKWTWSQRNLQTSSNKISWMQRVEKRAFKFETIWNFMKLLKVVAIRNHISLRKDVYTFSTFYMMLFESLLHIIKQIHLSNLYVETENGKKKHHLFPPGWQPPLQGRVSTPEISWCWWWGRDFLGGEHKKNLHLESVFWCQGQYRIRSCLSVSMLKFRGGYCWWLKSQTTSWDVQNLYSK